MRLGLALVRVAVAEDLYVLIEDDFVPAGVAGRLVAGVLRVPGDDLAVHDVREVAGVASAFATFERVRGAHDLEVAVEQIGGIPAARPDLPPVRAEQVLYVLGDHDSDALLLHESRRSGRARGVRRPVRLRQGAAADEEAEK